MVINTKVNILFIYYNARDDSNNIKTPIDVQRVQREFDEINFIYYLYIIFLH